MNDQKEYNQYVLGKFEVALTELDYEGLVEYDFQGHTDELNFCIMALAAMGEE